MAPQASFIIGINSGSQAPGKTKSKLIFQKLTVSNKLGG